LSSVSSASFWALCSSGPPGAARRPLTDLFFPHPNPGRSREEHEQEND
jgi:hypothetical protein